MGSGALGMDDSFWNTLTGEMGEFIEEVEVLEKDWSVGAGGQRVLIVIEGCASGGGDQLWVA